MSATKERTAGRLTYISPTDIEKNPQNPRLLFEPEPMMILRKSISEVGILVPLLVYQRASDQKYIILDGERRWRCAIELDMKEVPVNIIPEPSTVQNILTMFNIHNVASHGNLHPWR